MEGENKILNYDIENTDNTEYLNNIDKDLKKENIINNKNNYNDINHDSNNNLEESLNTKENKNKISKVKYNKLENENELQNNSHDSYQHDNKENENIEGSNNEYDDNIFENPKIKNNNINKKVNEEDDKDNDCDGLEGAKYNKEVESNEEREVIDEEENVFEEDNEDEKDYNDEEEDYNDEEEEISIEEDKEIDVIEEEYSEEKEVVDEELEYNKEEDDEYNKEDDENNEKEVEYEEDNEYNDEEENNDDEDQKYLTYLKNILKKIFDYYSFYGNKNNNNEKIKSTQIIKLMKDINIIDRNLTINIIDLKFKYISKNKMTLNFKEFLVFINDISQLKIKLDEESKNFQFFIEKFLEPLYKKLNTNNSINFDSNLYLIKIDYGTLMILFNKIGIFNLIYKKYFKKENENTNNMNKVSLINLSKNNLIQFLKDYQIIPNLVKIPLTIELFNITINIKDNDLNYKNSLIRLQKLIKKDFGHIFKFSKFIFYIYSLAYFIFSKKENIPNYISSNLLTNDEKFYLFLEKLEINNEFFDNSNQIGIKGYHKFIFTSEELAKIHYETGTYPNFEKLILKDINESNFMILKYGFKKKEKRNKSNFKLNKLKITKNLNHNDIEDQIKQNNSKSQNKNSTNNLSSNTFNNFISKYKAILFEIFSKYSNNDKKYLLITSIKFNKFIKEFKIIEKSNGIVNFNELDILYKQYQNLNDERSKETKYSIKNNKVIEQITLNPKNYQSKKGINFENFSKILVIVSKNIYKLSSNESFNLFYKNFIECKVPKNSIKDDIYTLNLIKLLKDKEVIKILSELHKIFKLLLKKYVNKNSEIDFKGFFNFYKNYEIFPKLISKFKLELIFKA